MSAWAGKMAVSVRTEAERQRASFRRRDAVMGRAFRGVLGLDYLVIEKRFGLDAVRTSFVGDAVISFGAAMSQPPMCVSTPPIRWPRYWRKLQYAGKTASPPGRPWFLNFAGKNGVSACRDESKRPPNASPGLVGITVPPAPRSQEAGRPRSRVCRARKARGNRAPLSADRPS